MLLKDKIKNPILKNIFILFTGTGVSQLIPVVTSLLLARLYSKIDYGEFSVFSSIVGILGVIAAFRYELAIVQVPKENDARNLLVLSLSVSTLFSIVIFIALFYGRSLIVSYVDINNYNILFFVPLVVFFTGFFNSFYSWFNRSRNYITMSLGQVLQTSTTSMLKIWLGLLGIGLGLIYGTVWGMFIVAVYYSFLYYKINSKNNKYCFNISFSKIKKLAWEYRDFAIYSTIGGFFNSISNIGLPIIISYFYGIEIAGIYFFANTIVKMPINLLSSSVAQIYKKEASILYNKSDSNLYFLTLKMQKIILIFVVPILIILLLFGTSIFSFFFGNKWQESGEIIKYFAIYVLFNSLYSPISSIADILRKQKLLLLFNISLVLSQILIFILAKGIAFKYALFISSIVTSVHFILLDHYMKYCIRKRLLLNSF